MASLWQRALYLLITLRRSSQLGLTKSNSLVKCAKTEYLHLETKSPFIAIFVTTLGHENKILTENRTGHINLLSLTSLTENTTCHGYQLFSGANHRLTFCYECTPLSFRVIISIYQQNIQYVTNMQQITNAHIISNKHARLSISTQWAPPPSNGSHIMLIFDEPLQLDQTHNPHPGPIADLFLTQSWGPNCYLVQCLYFNMKYYGN